MTGLWRRFLNLMREQMAQELPDEWETWSPHKRALWIIVH